MLQLLDFFKAECEERGATIVYATHIFDGLERWITHVAYMEDGQIAKGGCQQCMLPGLWLCPVAQVEAWSHSSQPATRALQVGAYRTSPRSHQC